MSDDEAATAGMWAVSGNKKTDSLTSIIKSISYFFIKSFYTDEGEEIRGSPTYAATSSPPGIVASGLNYRAVSRCSGAR